MGINPPRSATCCVSFHAAACVLVPSFRLSENLWHCSLHSMIWLNCKARSWKRSKRCRRLNSLNQKKRVGYHMLYQHSTQLVLTATIPNCCMLRASSVLCWCWPLSSPARSLAQSKGETTPPKRLPLSSLTSTGARQILVGGRTRTGKTFTLSLPPAIRLPAFAYSRHQQNLSYNIQSARSSTISNFLHCASDSPTSRLACLAIASSPAICASCYS